MSFLLAVILASTVSAATGDCTPDSVDTPALTHHLGASVGYDYMTSSVSDDLREKTEGEDKVSDHSALPLHLRYSFTFTDPAIPNYFPGGYQGIGMGLMNIGFADSGGVGKARRFIGYPTLVYVFQGGPFWNINSRLSLNYEWNFGASFGWKPLCDYNENYNLTVGSRVNAYLNLSLQLEYSITEKISLFGGLGVSHFSNGNTSWPNPGVNSFGARVGIKLTLNKVPEKILPVVDDTVKKRKLQYDLTLWGASRKRVYRGGDKPVLLNGHYACAGVSFAPMLRLGRWWRVGGSADLQWDESSDLKKNYIEGSNADDIKFTRPSFGRQLSVGIAAHGELQMPVFAVNVGLGYNLLAPEENRGFYQNLTLKTYIGKKFYINVGYQLRNFNQQAHLMLGAGLTI